MKTLSFPWPMVMDFADVLDRDGYTTLARETRQMVWNEAERRWLELTRVDQTMTDGYDPVELLAKVLEYEHALKHVALVSDISHPTACPDCQRLGQSALDGVGRDDFREWARELIEAASDDA